MLLLSSIYVQLLRPAHDIDISFLSIRDISRLLEV